jgi:hypothetical protein
MVARPSLAFTLIEIALADASVDRPGSSSRSRNGDRPGPDRWRRLSQDLRGNQPASADGTNRAHVLDIRNTSL